MRKPEREDDYGSRGSGLVMAIFIMALLTTLGISLLFMSQNEMKMTDVDRARKKTFFLAESGLEAAREQLNQLNIASGTADLDDELAGVTGPNAGIDLLDGSALAPIYDGNGNVTGISGAGDDTPLQPLTAFGDGWFAAYLTNDAGDGVVALTDNNERVMITAIGIGPRQSVEVVQAIVVPDHLFPMPPAAITLLGPSPNFQQLSNSADGDRRLVGTDCDGSGGIPGLRAPVVGAIGSAAEAQAETGMGTPETTYVSGTNSGTTAFADVTDASEPTVATSLGVIDAEWTDCAAVQNMLADLESAADYVCDERGGEICVQPATSATSVTFIDGDFQPTSNGAGVLVVTGTLTVVVSWNGVLLAIGEGNFSRSGSNHKSTSGASVVADIAGPDSIYGTADDCTGGSGGFTTASYVTNLGGHEDDNVTPTVYCTDDILPIYSLSGQKVASFAQR